MQTIPSLLEKSPQDLFSQINKLSPYFKRFQIDIADGIFVNNRTVQIEDIINFLKGLSTLDPYKNLLFDFHLMVKDYEKEIKKLEKLRDLLIIKNVFVNYDFHNYSLFTSHYSLFNIGLTLNPQDQVTDLTSHYALDTIPCLQIMSVVPGVQGNPFLPDTLLKIEQLRLLGYKSKIFLDGAVNEKTISIIMAKKFQPDFVCPGSFLTKAPNLKERVKYLKNYK